MADSYRSLFLLLLPLVACGEKEDDDTGDTGDTGTPPITERETGCYQLPSELTDCVPPGDVPLEQVIPQTCGAAVVSVDGNGTLSDGCDWIGGFAPSAWCIYPITVIPPEDECDYGRPLMIQGAPHLAPLVRREGWTAGRTTTPADPEGAATWARIGLAEHASVASFHRFALELMALGAPESLVRLAHEAATDELRHARLAFGFASDLAQVELGPGPLSLEGLTLDTDLVAFARATAREGCIAETLSALQMAEARDRASDPRQRAVLEGIARDEAKHAALAWRALRWALDQGGEEVRLAVVEVFSRAPSLPVSGGLLPPELACASVQRGWQEVVRPAALRLLGGGTISARDQLQLS